MKRTILFSALLFASFACGATDIASSKWLVSQQKELDAAFDLPGQTQHLLEKILPNADVVTPTVGEACFADLDRDGNLELIATVDYGGRGFFNNVVVVRQQQDSFTWTDVTNDGRAIENLQAHLIDADGDGVPELILEKFMGRYEGARGVPVETVIYRWGPAGFSDESDAFPQFYRAQVIPKLERQLAQVLSTAASKTSSSVGNNDELSMLKAELARARQRGGIR
jgi:hypothetical protein